MLLKQWKNPFNGPRVCLSLGLIVIAIIVSKNDIANATQNGIFAQYSVKGVLTTTLMGDKGKKKINEIIYLFVRPGKIYFLSGDHPIGFDLISKSFWRDIYVTIPIEDGEKQVLTESQREKMLNKMRTNIAGGDSSPISLEDIGEVPIKRTHTKTKALRFSSVSLESIKGDQGFNLVAEMNERFKQEFFNNQEKDIEGTLSGTVRTINGHKCKNWKYRYGKMPGFLSVIDLEMDGEACIEQTETYDTVYDLSVQIPDFVYRLLGYYTKYKVLLSIIRKSGGMPIYVAETVKTTYGYGSGTLNSVIELVDSGNVSAKDFSIQLPEQHRKGFLDMFSK